MSQELIPTEYQECVTLVEYLELRNLTFSHVPQETFTKSWGVKKKNNMQGVRKGVPDYIVIVPKGLLFIEMKTVDKKLKSGDPLTDWKIGQKSKGGLDREQREWLVALQRCHGVEARVCYGAEEAIAFVEEFCV